MEKMSFKNKHSLKQNEFEEKYEILDEKYKKMKDIFKEVLKDLKNEKEKGDILSKKCENLSLEVKKKDDLLEKMQTVSEAVVDEFSVLRVKCELETEAASNAIKRATRYFNENQKLKENLHYDVPAIFKHNDSNISSEEPIYESISEIEVLNTLNSELRTEVALLKTQVNKEIEKQTLLKDDFEIIKNLYEQEMREHKYTEEKWKSLQLLYDSLRADVLPSNAETCEKGKPFIIQTTNEESECLDDSNLTSTSISTTERDLKATLALVEKQKVSLHNRVKELEQQIQNSKFNGVSDVPLYTPQPPPPPPPPSFNPIKSLITFINAGKKSTRKPTIVPKEDCEDDHQKAMSEMINAIKKGNIQLKPVSKTMPKKEKDNSEPLALVEMRNILETLKKRECPLETPKVEETKNDNLTTSQTETATNKQVELSNNYEDLLNEAPCILNSPLEEKASTLNSGTQSNFQTYFEYDLKSCENYDDLSNKEVSSDISDCNGNKLKLAEHLSDTAELQNDKEETVMVI